MMSNSDGLSIQAALRSAEIVNESRMTEMGPGDWYSLKLGGKIVPLGTDRDYAKSLCFAIRRNAEAWDRPALRDTD